MDSFADWQRQARGAGRHDSLTSQYFAPVAQNEGVHRTATFRHIVDAFVDVNCRQVVDLGAAHCIFSKICRDRGGLVTAVDGRTDRVPTDGMDGIEFVHRDIRAFDVTGFDVKLVLGLLYHLGVDDQIALLKQCAAKGATIIDTQVHWADIITIYPQAEWQRTIVQLGEYQGLLFPEEERTTASIGNKLSFWPTEESLNKMLVNVGFSSITIFDPAYVSKYGVRRFYVAQVG